VLVCSSDECLGRRGTDTPFEIRRAPWIEGDKLAEYLNQRGVPGAVCAAAVYAKASVFKDQECGGVKHHRH
jgi:uncharacterized protein YbbC (DUF1343 family)